MEKVTFTLDGGAAMSVAPKSLGKMITRWQLKNRDCTKQRLENPYKMKDVEYYRL